jgi:molybdopterin synthase catalytic subunit
MAADTIAAMRPELLVRITPERLDASEALAFVADPRAGGTVLFAGTVRDQSDAGSVSELEYEAWEERATACLYAIGDEMFDRWPLVRAALVHRIGRLEVGEASVVVCCSAAHRAEAFEAARFGIERIKHDAPIWKKERLSTGDARWVMGS